MADFDTTAAAVIIPTEKLGEAIDGYGYPARTGLVVCASVETKGSIAVRMPRWGVITPTAGTKTEGANFSEVVPAMAEESLTPGIVGFEIPVTDETVEGVISGVPGQLLSEAIEAMATRMDADIHAAANSATNVQGAVTDVWNRAKVTAAAAAYRALNINLPGAQHALVVGSAGQTQLEYDEIVNAATKSAGMFATVQATAGYLGQYGQFQLFSAGTQIATEGGGNSNYMTPIGDGKSGIAIGVTKRIQIEGNRGSEGARAAMQFFVVSAWYGAAMRNRTRLLQILSTTA
jgi:hypothetical protein